MSIRERVTNSSTLPSVSRSNDTNRILTTYQWGEGAIGTARYTGVSLKKVLKYCGGPKEGATDVEFQGVDTYFKKGQVYNYVVSVAYRKAAFNEVMLAWEMNGKPLPRIHGYPVRVLVFGYIGARYALLFAILDVYNYPLEYHV